MLINSTFVMELHLTTTLSFISRLTSPVTVLLQPFFSHFPLPSYSPLSVTLQYSYTYSPLEALVRPTCNLTNNSGFSPLKRLGALLYPSFSPLQPSCCPHYGPLGSILQPVCRQHASECTWCEHRKERRGPPLYLEKNDCYRGCR